MLGNGRGVPNWEQTSLIAVSAAWCPHGSTLVLPHSRTELISQSCPGLAHERHRTRNSGYVLVPEVFA